MFLFPQHNRSLVHDFLQYVNVDSLVLDALAHNLGHPVPVAIVNRGGGFVVVLVVVVVVDFPGSGTPPEGGKVAPDPQHVQKVKGVEESLTVAAAAAAVVVVVAVGRRLRLLLLRMLRPSFRACPRRTDGKLLPLWLDRNRRRGEAARWRGPWFHRWCWLVET